MIYLILAILSSACVSIFMRLSETKRQNNISMLCVNYVMCLALSLLFARGDGMSYRSDTLLWGLGNGLLYVASFVLLQWNVGENGVSLSATFMKLGVLVPTLVSVFCFGERPNTMQVIGFIIACVAIVMIQYTRGGDHGKKLWGLPVLLIFGGFTDALSKFFEELGDPAGKGSFLVFTFVAALVFCTALALYKKQKIGMWDILFGALIGIPNFGSARFLLLALHDLPAVIVCPTFSAAVILIVSLTGMAFFKERIRGIRIPAMILIMAALVLLNL